MEFEKYIEAKRFRHGDFIVEITKEDGIFEAYLQHKDYGVKSFIIGVPEIQNDDVITMSDFERMIEDMLEDHERYYAEDYMD